MRKLFFSVALLALVSATGCSGGGGGGGGGSGASTSSARTGARIIHGALEASPVSLRSSAAPEVVQTAPFAEATFYAELPTGAQNLTLSALSPAGDSYGTTSIEVQKNEHRSVFLYGNFRSLGFRSVVLDDAIPEVDETLIPVRFLNATVGAANIDVTIGDTNVTVPFGTASAYLPVARLALPVFVKRSVDGRPIFSGTRDFTSGAAKSVLITGEVGYLVTATIFED